MASPWRLEAFTGPADTFNASRQPIEVAEDAGQRERRYVRAQLRGLAVQLEAYGSLFVHVTGWGVVNERDGMDGDSANFSHISLPSPPG